MKNGWLPNIKFVILETISIWTLNSFATILQNFIYKNIKDLENVQRNKKKEKGEFTRCQVSSN
jgi:hypothetical protein